MRLCYTTPQVDDLAQDASDMPTFVSDDEASSAISFFTMGLTTCTRCLALFITDTCKGMGCAGR